MTSVLRPKPFVTRIEDRNGHCIQTGESVLVTPALCAQAILRPSPVMLTPLKCAKCGSTNHPSYARSGQSCTHGSSCPVELAEDNGAMCGGTLRAVAK